MQLVDGAADGVRDAFDGATHSAGPFTAALTRLGPAGAAAAAGLVALGYGVKAAPRQAGEAAKAFDEVAESAREMGVTVRMLEDLRAVTPTLKELLNVDEFLEDCDVVAFSGPMPYSAGYGAPVV